MPRHRVGKGEDNSQSLRDLIVFSETATPQQSTAAKDLTAARAATKHVFSVSEQKENDNGVYHAGSLKGKYGQSMQKTKIQGLEDLGEDWAVFDSGFSPDFNLQKVAVKELILPRDVSPPPIPSRLVGGRVKGCRRMNEPVSLSSSLRSISIPALAQATDVRLSLDDSRLISNRDHYLEGKSYAQKEEKARVASGGPVSLFRGCPEQIDWRCQSGNMTNAALQHFSKCENGPMNATDSNVFRHAIRATNQKSAKLSGQANVCLHASVDSGKHGMLLPEMTGLASRKLSSSFGSGHSMDFGSSITGNTRPDPPQRAQQSCSGIQLAAATARPKESFRNVHLVYDNFSGSGVEGASNPVSSDPFSGSRGRSAPGRSRFMSATACSSARVKVAAIGRGGSTGPTRRSVADRLSTESSKAVRQGGRDWQSKSHSFEDSNGMWQLRSGSVDFGHRVAGRRRNLTSSSVSLSTSCLLLADCQRSSSVDYGKLECREWDVSGGSSRNLERSFRKSDITAGWGSQDSLRLVQDFSPELSSLREISSGDRRDTRDKGQQTRQSDTTAVWGSQDSLRLVQKEFSPEISSLRKIPSGDRRNTRDKAQQTRQKSETVAAGKTSCAGAGRHLQRSTANQLTHAREDKHVYRGGNTSNNRGVGGRESVTQAAQAGKCGGSVPKSSYTPSSKGNAVRDSWRRQSLPGSLASRTPCMTRGHDDGARVTNTWRRLSDPPHTISKTAHPLKGCDAGTGADDAWRKLRDPPQRRRSSSGNVFERLAASPTVQSIARDRSNEDKLPLMSLQGKGLSRSMTVPVAVRASVLSQSTIALPVSTRPKNSVLTSERRLGHQSEVSTAAGCTAAADKHRRDRWAGPAAVVRRKRRSFSPPPSIGSQNPSSSSALHTGSNPTSDVDHVVVNDVFCREALLSSSSRPSSSNGLETISLSRASGGDDVYLSCTSKNKVVMEEKDSELYWDGRRWMVNFMSWGKPSGQQRASTGRPVACTGSKFDGSEAVGGGTRTRRNSYEKGNKAPPPVLKDRFKPVTGEYCDQGRPRGGCCETRQDIEPTNGGEYLVARVGSQKDEKHDPYMNVGDAHVLVKPSLCNLISDRCCQEETCNVDDGCVATMTDEEMDVIIKSEEEGNDAVEGQLSLGRSAQQLVKVVACQGILTKPEEVSKTCVESIVEELGCMQVNSSCPDSHPGSGGCGYIAGGKMEVDIDAVKKQLSVEPMSGACLEDMCNGWEGQPSPVSALDFPGSEDEASPSTEFPVSEDEASPAGKLVISNRGSAEVAEVQEQPCAGIQLDNLHPAAEGEDTVLEREVSETPLQHTVDNNLTVQSCRQGFSEDACGTPLQNTVDSNLTVQSSGRRFSEDACCREPQNTGIFAANSKLHKLTEASVVEGQANQVPSVSKEEDDEDSWIELLPPEAAAPGCGASTSEQSALEKSQEHASTGRQEQVEIHERGTGKVLLPGQDTNKDRMYVHSLLTASGFASADQQAVVKWHDPWHPLDPALYERLDQEISGGKACSVQGKQCLSTSSRMGTENSSEEAAVSVLPTNRRLLFDAVNNSLLQKLSPYKEKLSPWVKKCQPHISPRPTGQQLMEEVLMEMHDWYVLARNEKSTMDLVLRRDISRQKEEWSSFDKESSEMGCDMEEMILDRLLFEAVEDFVDIENKRSEKVSIFNPLFVED